MAPLAGQVPSSSGAKQSRVQRLVAIHHTAHIEALERRRLDRRPIQPIQSLIEEGELLCVVADEPIDPVAQDLEDRTGAASEDRRTAGERLDEDQTERLRPR